MMRHANYSIVGSFPDRLIVRDDGPWDKHPTITNDAEHVVSELSSHLDGRMLLYVDSEGRTDQLLVKDGRFAGFAPGPKE
jgi:hypothetical protein